jgi:RHS repeat-associated protein
LLYDATGNKLRKVADDNGIVNTQDYVSGIEYRNNTLEAIYHPEGRVFNTGSSLRYEYSIRDHLGNTRLTFTDKNNDGTVNVTNSATTNEILQENHYYPFGLNMEGPWMNDAALDNKHQYNGKEWNDDFGLNWYAYGARWYDQATGRFTSIDPISDKFPHVSTFNYAENEPVGSIDLHGLQKVSFKDKAFGFGVGAINALLNNVRFGGK